MSPTTLAPSRQRIYARVMMDMFRNLSAALLLTLLLSPAAMADDAQDQQVESGLAALKSKDFPEAIRILLPLAVEGNAEAQFQIGLMYYKGDGLPKDRCVAIVWLEKAARQAHARAALMTGFTFYFGGGVKKSHELAYRWASFAHKLGHSQAKNQMFVFGHDLPQDKKDAIDRDMETWNPAQLPQTEYFFIDGSTLQPLDYYRKFVKRTSMFPCR